MNSKLFSTKTLPGIVNAPVADTVNVAGGAAFSYTPQHYLAQLMMTGTLFDTFYSKADEQYASLLDLAGKVSTEYLAKATVASATLGYMKDMACAGLTLLSVRPDGKELYKQIFNKVIHNGRMLRTHFQMIRSRTFGCHSLSHVRQRAFCTWLNEASPSKLLNAAIGDNPALADILALARPRPSNAQRRALFAFLLKKPLAKPENDEEELNQLFRLDKRKKPLPGSWAMPRITDLPEEARLLRAFRNAMDEESQLGVLDSMLAKKAYIRWDLLSDSAIGPMVWKAIALTMAPQALRMNLNTLQRHGVFDDPVMVAHVADRLTDVEEIKSSRQFPYQYFAAYKFLDPTVPHEIRTALHKSAELCCGNVPHFPGPVVICIDVSGSMDTSVTGHQGAGKTSKVKCVDTAAVFAAALLRANPGSVVVPFNDRALTNVNFDHSDSMLSLADQLSRLVGGGTDCHQALAHVNARHSNRPFCAVIYLSDNASWVTPVVSTYFGYPRSMGHPTTALMAEWQQFASRQAKLGKFPQPKMVCVDLQHYGTTQAPEDKNILNLGGYSDVIFHLISAFIEDDTMRFVRLVEEIRL